jgi:pimeloyl-ACP methyl ester carboxylesterase
MDATASGRVVLVALSMGAQWATLLAARHPDRVAGIVFVGPSMRLLPPGSHTERGAPFDEVLPAYEGWDRYNRHAWRADFRGFLEFFFAECLPERHSTKPIEDCVAWGLETDAETLLLTEDAPDAGDRVEQVRLAGSIRCPVLVIHGSDDRIIPHAVGEELARLTRGRLLTLEGAGHLPLAREPVRTNLAIRAFVDDLPRGIA